MNDIKREQFEEYISGLLLTPDAALQAIQDSADMNDLPKISVSPLDGYFLQWLTRLASAKRLSIGDAAEYSAAWIARGMAEGGTLFCVERAETRAHFRENRTATDWEHGRYSARGGKRYFAQMTAHGPFDLVFIDADKPAIPIICSGGGQSAARRMVGLHNAIAVDA